MTKWTHNQHYWNEPTIENSYWAGFIAADGSIRSSTKVGNELRFFLQCQDQNTITLFQRALNHDGRQYQHNTGKAIGVVIGAAKEILFDLARYYNITSAKSLTLQPPNITDIEMIKAFIIGYIDGDGWIGLDCRNARKYCYPRIMILGTESVLNWMRSIFINNLGAMNIKISALKQNKAFRLNISGKNVYTIVSWLNMVHVPRLQRKWAKVEGI